MSQLLDRHLCFIISLLWCRLQHIVVLLVYLDAAKQIFIDYTCFDFPLEESKEELPELINRDETPFIFNHLIQLLLQIVEYPVVHHILVDVSEHYLSPTIISLASEILYLLSVVFYHLGSHGSWSLTLSHLLLAITVLPSLRKWDSI